MGSAPIAGGDVLLDGRSLVGRRPEDVARRGIALVPEGRRIFGELTVEENLRLGLAGRRKRQQRRRPGARVRALPDPARVPLAPRRRALARRRRGLAMGERSPPILAAVDEPSLGWRRSRRRRLRGARANQGRGLACPRRAAGPANRRTRRPLLRARQRRLRLTLGPTTRRHRLARSRVPRMTLAFLDLSWPVFADAVALGGIYASSPWERPRLRRAAPRNWPRAS